MLFQKQQINLPLELKSVTDDGMIANIQEQDYSICDRLEKQNTQLSQSKSFHQDLSRSDSEQDFVLNYKGIQSYILQDSNKKNKNQIDIKRNTCFFKENYGNQMSKYSNQAFYSRTKVLKDQNKQSDQQSFISNTPSKQFSQNIDNRSFIMRKTTAILNPIEKFIAQKEYIQSKKNGLDKIYSINKIKNKLKQQSRSRSYTMQDAILIEGKNSKDNSDDQILGKSQQSINIQNDVDRKKIVIYSKKSTVIGNSPSSIFDRQSFSVSSKRNPSINSPEIKAIQIENHIKNQSFSQMDLFQTGQEKPFQQQNQLYPPSPEYNHQKFRPFKLPQSPYSRQNKKLKNDFQSDQLSSSHQNNYLALFPVNSFTNSPKKFEQIKNNEEQGLNNEFDEIPKYQFPNQFYKHKKVHNKQKQGFKLIHMNDINVSNISNQQVPSFCKNIILSRNDNYSKVNQFDKLRPIRIQDRN